jgi:hypothetical protein
MDDIQRQILEECRRVAEHSMWNIPKPKSLEDVITSDEREVVAQAYFRAAEEALGYVASDPDGAVLGPKVVLRAVRYLGKHAVFPNRDRVAWFAEGLSLLIQIAHPHSLSVKGGEPFFADLRRGMDLADQWAREHFIENDSKAS